MTIVADDALVTSIVDGDRDAFTTLYDRYGDRIYDFCYSMLHDAAEAADVTQDTFLMAFEKLDKLRDRGKVKSWLYAVARNDCLKRIRRRSREVASSDALEDLVAEEEIDERSDSNILRELVWSAAEGLAPRDQALLDLHVRQGLNGQELADAVGVNVSNVYVMVNRLKAQFERAMGALLVVRLARTDCPDLQAILESSGDEFTALVRKRVARHIEGCETCEGNRRRLASPLALLTAIPMVPAPLLLRDRVLHHGPSSGHGAPGSDSGAEGDAATEASRQSPKLSGRTGFPKSPSALTSAPFVAVAAVVVLAAVTGITLTALASTTSHQHKQAQAHSVVTLTTTSTVPQSNSGKQSLDPNTTTSGKGPTSTTAPLHGATSTTVPPNKSTQANTTPIGSTGSTQPGSNNQTVAPICALGANRSIAMAVTGDGGGYWITQSNGDVIAYGDATQYPASTAASAPMSSISTVPGSSGYVLLESDGTVVGVGATTEGSASSVGSACDAVAVAATPDGHGYWIALSTGAVLNFGDADFYGDASDSGTLVVGLAATPDGKGYWLVGSNGAVLPYGDAVSYGSASSLHLSAPIVGMAATPDGKGYWLVASNGGIFGYGDANFYGSAAPSSTPVVALTADSSGTGYWNLEADGQVLPYGSAQAYPQS
jgi:RNA polymerase sigma factor (sigma-70 family)